MTLYQKVELNIRNYLKTCPTQENLKKFLQNPLLDELPKAALHHLNIQQIKEPTLLYVKLMVQDIRQNCYSYPYIIEKPLKQQSKIHIFKYGHKQTQFSIQMLNDPNFCSVIQDRQTVVCTPVLYETQWVKEVQKNVLKEGQFFEIIVEKLNIFKLGQVLSAVCVFQPENKQLYYVRESTKEEIKTWENIDQYLSQKDLKPQQAKENLLKIFNEIYSEKYSQFMLFSFISTQFLFISATENHSDLLKKILPRVCQVKIKAPFKQSLFPYKNEEQKLVRAPMQTSQAHTFIILDFCNFTSESQIKIGPQQIDNIKALKQYVQEGNTIYRWLYGESHIKHNNTGLIVKASSIINPQYIIPEQKKEIKEIPQISQSDLRQLRSYINYVRKLNPTLKGDFEIIEKEVKSDGIKFNQISLVKVMELAKLNARSKGSDQIKFEDFQVACQLFF